MQRPGKVWRRFRWVILSIGLMSFVLLFLSYALRTSSYLKLRLSPKLESLGESVCGSFSFSQVHAIGVTGILFENLRFTASGEVAPIFSVPQLVIYPDMLGMFVGDLDAKMIELRSAKAELILDERMLEHFRCTGMIRGAGSTAGVSTKGSLSKKTQKLPIIRLLQSDLRLELGERTANFRVRDARFAVSEDFSSVQIEGEKHRVCVSKDSQDECTDFQVKSLHLSDSLRVEKLELDAINWRDLEIKKLLIDDLAFERRGADLALGASSAEFEMRFPSFDGIFNSPLQRFQFLNLQILWEKENQRLGIGLSIQDAKDQVLMIYGAFVPESKDFAFSLETKAFDLHEELERFSLGAGTDLQGFPFQGSLKLRYTHALEELTFSLNASVQDAALFSERLSKQALEGIDLEADFNGTCSLAKRELRMREGVLAFGRFPIEIDLDLNWEENFSYKLDLFAKFENDAALFLPSLPNGFAPALEGYELTGPAKGSLRLSYRSDELEKMIFEPQIELKNVRTLRFNPQSDFSLLKTNAFKIRVKAATTPKMIGPRESSWVRYKDVRKILIPTLIASEDGKFFQHPGFDVRAIRASIIANLTAKKIVRGGSTISQQVVKNLFLNHDKTYARKFQEAFLTWQMENHLPKDRILELYINLAHWGVDIYGIKEAADYYFNKRANRLSLRESIFLAAILPNPVIFGRQYSEGRLSTGRVQKMLNILAVLRLGMNLDEDEYLEEAAALSAGKISKSPKPEFPKKI